MLLPSGKLFCLLHMWLNLLQDPMILLLGIATREMEMYIQNIDFYRCPEQLCSL